MASTQLSQEIRRQALLVGASRGLGLGLAQELVRRGWGVVATAREPKGSEALQTLARERKGSIEIEGLDVASSPSSENFVRAMQNRSFDLLFLNAGVFGPQHQSVHLATEAELDDLLLTNAFAPVRLAYRLVDTVTPDRGVVAFMTSRLGSVAANTSGGMDLYRASKAALNSLSRGFAVCDAVTRRRLTVLSLHPGWVRTDMGGKGAPLDVATSVRGLAEVLEARAGAGGHVFLDYQGNTIPW
jgi:NAD(P)-dependent dehydrogenase (short-subunit alcohol dehydrogenase family)